MNILLIEDDSHVGQAWKTWLESHGHTVTWIVGVKSVNGMAIHGMSAVGEKHAQTYGSATIEQWFWHPQDVIVNANEFNLIFVDGKPEKGSLEGVEIVKILAALKLTCVGISSYSSNNEQMQAQGAVFGVTKVDLLTIIFADIPVSTLDFQNITFQQELTAFVAQHQDDAELKNRINNNLLNIYPLACSA